MAIDPSLCDYGRKNESEIRELDRLTLDDASRLKRRIEDTLSDNERTCGHGLLTAAGVLVVTVVYAVVAHVIRGVWIAVERRGGRRVKSPPAAAESSNRRKQRTSHAADASSVGSSATAHSPSTSRRLATTKNHIKCRSSNSNVMTAGSGATVTHRQPELKLRRRTRF